MKLSQTNSPSPEAEAEAEAGPIVLMSHQRLGTCVPAFA